MTSALLLYLLKKMLVSLERIHLSFGSTFSLHIVYFIKKKNRKITCSFPVVRNWTKIQFTVTYFPQLSPVVTFCKILLWCHRYSTVISSMIYSVKPYCDGIVSLTERTHWDFSFYVYLTSYMHLDVSIVFTLIPPISLHTAMLLLSAIIWRTFVPFPVLAPPTISCSTHLQSSTNLNLFFIFKTRVVSSWVYYKYFPFFKEILINL